MDAQVLRSEDQIRLFAETFSGVCRNPVDLDYFANADCVRAFYRDGRMVGGYVVNARAPLRYLRMIPEAVRSEPPLASILADGNACEIACLWLSRARLTTQQRNNVYLLAAMDALATRRRWIVGGSISPKLAQTQKRVLPRVLYTGPWEYAGSPPEAQIYCAGWWQLATLIAAAYSRTTTEDFLRRNWARLCGRRTRWR